MMMLFDCILSCCLSGQAMGVVQHHDGVSGTEKQAVAFDYAERLANGINQCQVGLTLMLLVANFANTK